MGHEDNKGAAADIFEDTQVLKRTKPPDPPLVVVRAAFGSTLAHWIAQPSSAATLGRSPDAEIVLPDPSVSRFHARIDVDALGSLTITDLRSTNGTFVNQEPIGDRARVEPGDRVLVGDVPLVVERMTPVEVEAMKRATHRLEEAARDALTGLFTRSWLDTELTDWMARHRGGGETVCCLFIDIDHFKRINDLHKDHAVGDRVLRGVCDLLRKAIRDDDVAVRYGGDEIVVFLAKCRLAVGKAVAERVRSAVALHSWEDRIGAGEITLSIGVAQHRASEAVEEWLGRADAALYKAKERRNCTVTADAPRG